MTAADPILITKPSRSGNRSLNPSRNGNTAHSAELVMMQIRADARTAADDQDLSIKQRKHIDLINTGVAAVTCFAAALFWGHGGGRVVSICADLRTFA